MFKYWGIQACVNVVKEQLKGMRKNAKTAFASSVYEKIKKMTKKANVEVIILWACDRQTFRNNTNARTQVAYFRRTIFLLFLDNLLEQCPL